MIYVVSKEGFLLHEYPDEMEAAVRAHYKSEVIRREAIVDWEKMMLDGGKVVPLPAPSVEETESASMPTREEIQKAELTLLILEVLERVQ